MDKETWNRAFGSLPPKKQTEKLLHQKVVNYLKRYHPWVRFKSGMEGEKLSSAFQASSIMAKQYGPGHPDLMIYKGCGLALELKKETPFRMDGKLKAGIHLRQQQEWLEYLRKEGWECHFVWTLEQAHVIIDEFLLNKRTK